VTLVGSQRPNLFRIDQAIRTLKRRGNRVNWVKLKPALWATDDPTSATASTTLAKSGGMSMTSASQA
jgi:hypothetical protein